MKDAIWKAPGETDDQFKQRVIDKLGAVYPAGGAKDEEFEFWWEVAMIDVQAAVGAFPQPNHDELQEWGVALYWCCSSRFFDFYFTGPDEELL